MAGPSFTRSFLRLFSGPIIWALHFLAVYGFTGVVCARPGVRDTWLGISVFTWGIGVASLLAIAAVIVLHVRDWRAILITRQFDFLRLTASGLGLLSIVAMVWETLPVLMLPLCN